MGPKMTQRVSRQWHLHQTVLGQVRRERNRATHKLFKTQQWQIYNVRMKRADMRLRKAHASFQQCVRKELDCRVSFRWAGEACCMIGVKPRKALNINWTVFGIPVDGPHGDFARAIMHSEQKLRDAQQASNKESELIRKLAIALNEQAMAASTYARIHGEVEAMKPMLSRAPERGVKYLTEKDRAILADMNTMRLEMYRYKRIAHGKQVKADNLSRKLTDHRKTMVLP
jgi:hypothetical protein